MRQIKFRSWDGVRIQSPRYTEARISIRGLRQGDDFILMQFTGLLDKNGKEIYEGDVVKVPMDDYVIGVIRWSNKNSCFYLDETVVESYCWAGLHDMCEVIGNIYENGDLLNGE